MQGTRQSDEGEYYGFAWWAIILQTIAELILAAIEIGVVVFLGLVMAPAGIVGWLITAAVALWAIYGFVIYASFFTRIQLTDEGFRAGVLFWWRTFPWRDVRRMRYSVLPYHIVWVRGRGPIPRFFFFPFFRREEAVYLSFGLHHRSQLFHEIWRRASQAQERDVPVTGLLGRPWEMR